jgi:hypothetical protein
MTPTRTFLPLDDAYTLTPQQIADYRQNGHVCLPAVCSSQEVAQFEPVITGASQRFNPEKRPLEERDTFGKAFTWWPVCGTVTKESRALLWQNASRASRRN